jgi:HlyD family secretion protein
VASVRRAPRQLQKAVSVDIARPDSSKRKRNRRLLYAASGLVVVLVLGVGISRLEPAAPGVDRTTLWIDKVQRGPLLRQVRGTGTLVPEDSRWIPAATSGRVEQIIVRPGSEVEADTVILELSNPTLEQELQDAKLRVESAEAGLTNLRVQLETDQLQREASTAIIEADYKKASLQAEVNKQLASQQLVSTLTLQQSQLDQQLLASRLEIARKQLDKGQEQMRARLAAEQANLDQVRALRQLKQRQVDELRVRPGIPGVLQIVPVEIGQQVGPGTNLARVANPTRLKAELKIAETQARDIQIGQPVSIDTRNGLVDGKVSRIDPSVLNGTVTVDVTIEGTLPRGSRPDLTVDGTIELERMIDVLFVGRPALGQEQSAVGLFKVDPDGTASRIQVKIGRMSVDKVELLSGLNAGDEVVLSDMSAWDAYDRVRLQ